MLPNRTVVALAAMLAAALLPAGIRSPLASAAAAAAETAPKPALDSKAAQAILTVRPDDRVLGRPDAKATVFEFASLTCPHCAHFEVEMLPRVEKDDIATGKLRLVFRDFPLDRLAFVAALLARCVPMPDRSMALIRHLFATQAEWVGADDPLAALRTAAAPYGLGPTEADACLKDQDRIRAMLQGQKDAIDYLGIDSTPSFVSGTTLHAGMGSYEEFRAFLAPLLK